MDLLVGQSQLYDGDLAVERSAGWALANRSLMADCYGSSLTGFRKSSTARPTSAAQTPDVKRVVCGP